MKGAVKGAGLCDYAIFVAIPLCFFLSSLLEKALKQKDVRLQDIVDELV